MSASFLGNPSSYLPLEYSLPNDPSEMRCVLRDYLIDISAAVNSRDVGVYVTQETICGQLWLPTQRAGASTSLTYRQVLRLVVETGTLSTGANAVAHGLSVTSSTHFTRVYGIIENPGTLYVPIPNDTVLVTVDATNINITIPSAYNNFSGQVILEYVGTD